MLPMALVAVKKHFAFLSLLIFLKTFCSLFLLFFFSPHCLPSAGWLVTWRSTNHICGIPLDERSVAEGPKRRIWSTIFHCILGKKEKEKKRNPTPCYFYIIVAYDLYAFLVCGYCCAMLPVLSVLLDVTVIQKRRKYPGRTYSILAGHAGGDFADGGVLIQYNVMRHRSTALRGRGEVKKSSPHEVKDLLGFFFPLLLFYCEGCGAVLSGLLSWAAGALLLQGALLPRAGELLKSSSSSRPLVASYCVFSRRVIKRSSSSPNSPPIRVGSPTTITSLRKREKKRGRYMIFFILKTEKHIICLFFLLAFPKVTTYLNCPVSWVTLSVTF